MKWTWLLVALGILAITPAPASAQNRAEALSRLVAMDANHDGLITRAEAQAGRAVMFARLDANGDGALDAQERGGERAQRMLANADANGDGRITRDEFMGQPYRAFDRLDGDNDGVLTSAELAPLRAQTNGGG